MNGSYFEVQDSYGYLCHQNALFDILYNTIIWKYEKITMSP